MHNEDQQIGNLLSALTLQALTSLQNGNAGLQALERKIDVLTQIVVRSHRAEIEQIDSATNEIAKQLEEIAAGKDADTVARLKQLSAKLNSMGRPVDQPVNS